MYGCKNPCCFFSFSYCYFFLLNQTGNTWQNGVNDDGVVDPYGSKAIHGAIGRVLHGAHYDRSKPVYITQEQFGFFIYVVSSILLFYVILLIHGCA